MMTHSCVCWLARACNRRPAAATAMALAPYTHPQFATLRERSSQSRTPRAPDQTRVGANRLKRPAGEAEAALVSLRLAVIALLLHAGSSAAASQVIVEVQFFETSDPELIREWDAIEEEHARLAQRQAEKFERAASELVAPDRLKGLDPARDFVTILLAGDKLPSSGPSPGERRAFMEQRVSLLSHVRPLLVLECVVSLGEAVTYRTWSPNVKGWVEVLRVAPERIADDRVRMSLEDWSEKPARRDPPFSWKPAYDYELDAPHLLSRSSFRGATQNLSVTIAYPRHGPSGHTTDGCRVVERNHVAPEGDPPEPRPGPAEPLEPLFRRQPLKATMGGRPQVVE